MPRWAGYSVAVLLAVLPACGGSGGPSAPSGPAANAPVVLTGTVSWPGGRLASATVTILDGPNASRSATSASDGIYRIEGLTAGNANVSATATGYEERRSSIALRPGPNNLDFTTRTLLPWSVSGVGNNVFDMPRYFDRVRIRGEWNRTGLSNFIVNIGGRLVVNEILRQSIIYEGIHLTNGGGVVSITNSSTITWTFTEERTL